MTTRRAKLSKLLPVDQPPPFEPVVQSGLRAMMTGTASEHQQIEVYRWLVQQLGGIGAQSYRSDPNAAAFMEGRRFVATTMHNLATEKGE